MLKKSFVLIGCWLLQVQAYTQTGSGSEVDSYERMFILLIVLLLLSSISVLVAVYTLKKLQSHLKMHPQISNSGDKLPVNSEQPIVATSDGSGEPPITASAIEAVKPTALIMPAVKSHASFVCEIMMTAGPRKKFMSEENADKDLGEDVCGFITTAEHVYMWLLDGTSDLHCLKNPADKKEYFSSRLLAVSMAESMRRQFVNTLVINLSEIVKQAIQEVKTWWLQEIDKLPDEEKQLLRKSIGNKNYPECAITLLTAQLVGNGDFTAYRSGDSKMYLYGETDGGFGFISTPLAEKNDESNDRIFFRLHLNETGNFDILSNEPLHEIVEQKRISTVISFSDGVGAETEHALRLEYDVKPEKVRMDIMHHLQATGDDKSIAVIELKEFA